MGPRLSMSMWLSREHHVSALTHRINAILTDDVMKYKYLEFFGRQIKYLMVNKSAPRIAGARVACKQKKNFC